MRKNKAFTLAETLLTLAIIGVVASLTIPTVVLDHKNKACAVGLSKAFSVLANATEIIKFKHGNPRFWSSSQIPSYYKNAIIVACDGSSCFDTSKYTDTALAGVGSYFVSNDIMFWGMSGYGCTGDTCMTFVVDVNGPQGPNQDGKDIFTFRLGDDNAIYPVGAAADVIRTGEIN